MNSSKLLFLAAIGASIGFLGACAELPTAPSVMALPGTGKTFDQFETDDELTSRVVYEHFDGGRFQAASFC
ncbi:hypothetical protein [Paraburkholderia xenovorans]|uniref:hypothetical protein n=1 Tax=Paraburkholderia xenovorans TaxID=36873 RepID=UPI0015C52F6C|nr:hypothetical protein [Paraburkholderia xenovorans]NPT39588.1 hypothetical protein [Paraburkholderia xenovorans]